MTQALRENWTSGEIDNMAGATKAWVSFVRDKAVWDYKVDIGIAELPKTVSIGEVDLNWQTVANIHFGAMGRTAGFSEEYLEAGAGAFQIYDNGIKMKNWSDIGSADTYFDDPYDNWMINFGSWLYDEYGSKFGSLKDDDLSEALNKYIKLYGHPGKPLSE